MRSSIIPRLPLWLPLLGCPRKLGAGTMEDWACPRKAIWTEKSVRIIEPPFDLYAKEVELPYVISFQTCDLMLGSSVKILPYSREIPLMHFSYSYRTSHVLSRYRGSLSSSRKSPDESRAWGQQVMDGMRLRRYGCTIYLSPNLLYLSQFLPLIMPRLQT